MLSSSNIDILQKESSAFGEEVSNEKGKMLLFSSKRSTVV